MLNVIFLRPACLLALALALAVPFAHANGHERQQFISLTLKGRTVAGQVRSGHRAEVISVFKQRAELTLKLLGRVRTATNGTFSYTLPQRFSGTVRVEFAGNSQDLRVAAGTVVTVTVQGDSLTAGAAPLLARALGRGYRVISQSSQVGRHTADGLSILRTQPLGDVIVFALGTNDYLDSPGWYRRELESARSLIGPRRCLVTASIYVGRAQGAFNRVLSSMAARYGPTEFNVAPWARAVSEGKVRLADGVHPASQSGWMQRARLLADAVHRCTG